MSSPSRRWLGIARLLLTLGLAITWRWRDRRWIAGGAVAALIVLKVFLWPMLLWLAFTRRKAAGVIALVVTFAMKIIGWGVTGFDGLRTYPHLLNLLSRVLEGRSYSVTALGLALGAGATTALALAAITGVTCLVVLALRGGGERSDAWTFIVAVGAALALSPIVWLHYFILLYVPLAIVSPRLGWLWITPLAFWAVGGQSTDPSVWERGRTSARGLDTASIGSPAIIGYAVLVATVLLAVLTSRAGRIDN